ncbi:arabinogalactan endo-1,4-beta-galactosidase [Pullulanibacillus sp. KACC 23026]|uniref:glycoside hydrolase family 53 protein n=1 Tax=Pullulanibacillus sp. KACC 23026 TaxID=3028315 RepID=UPI0023B184B5|nr:arabinogalactan endo-1,4-beta-galactosidase [Pullulanibacillus sp. KACC 23026]WEG12438.1 arabinogalactan endo-1,4-beta-galactosidase [Pullulanibacillus sp. KACC 23026]
MRRRLKGIGAIFMSVIVGVFMVISTTTVSFAKTNHENGKAPTAPFIKGADISSYQAIVDHGGVFYDHGQQENLLKILKDHGVNYIRLRLWVNPVQEDGYNNLANTIKVASEAKAMGFKFLLDIHYSDTWADPGKQTVPAAWQNDTFDQLTQQVHDYTVNVIRQLGLHNAAPDMVQIGNEITSGMLWPYGKDWTSEGFDNLATLLKAGISGVKANDPHAKIMLHIDQGGNNDTSRWFFDNITQRDVPFDIIGLSYYPYWHGTLAQLKNNMDDITVRYNKPVVIAETAYAYTLQDFDNEPNNFTADDVVQGYPATVQGQAKFMKDLTKTLFSVPNDQALGYFYWEPAWIPVQGAGWIDGGGDGWDNQTLFDQNGNALPSLNVFEMNRPVLTKH